MTDVGGQTTKRTYVTKYTTDVDPRTLPDFASRGVVTGGSGGRGGWEEGEGEDGQWAASRHNNNNKHHKQQRHPQPYDSSRDSTGAPPPVRHHTHSPANAATPESPVAGSVDGHRLRKKYTTTTVTTITTTTILLPKSQEAYVFPAMTTHQMEQQGHNQQALPMQHQQQRDRVYQIESGHTSPGASPDRQRQLQSSHPQGSGLVPAPTQYGPDGRGTQAWVFHQQTQHDVSAEQRQGRLPTLQELGITSYFANDGDEGRSQQQQQQQPRRPGSYAPASRRGDGAQQPWVTGETRHEVEGGKRYY